MSKLPVCPICKKLNIVEAPFLKTLYYRGEKGIKLTPADKLYCPKCKTYFDKEEIKK